MAVCSRWMCWGCNAPIWHLAEDGELPYEKGTGDLAVVPRRASISEDRRGTAFVELNKKEGCGLGLVLSGGLDKNTKAQISYLRPGGIAQRSDALEVNDYIVSVNGIRTALLRHDEIVNLLKNAGGSVVLEVEYELPDPPQDTASVQHKGIEVHLEREGQTYGFTLRGGLHTDSNKSRPLTVTQIRPGSSADREGTLKVGDRILMINGINVSQKTLSDAQGQLARPQSSVHLLVEYDISVMEAVQNATGPLLVEIDKTPGSNLGISLTTTSYKGRFVICIEAVKPASIADRCGALHVGDHVLAIDETNLEHISVAEATQLLRCGTPEHIKLEILPMRPTSHSKVSELSPRLVVATFLTKNSPANSAALSPVRQFTPRSPSPSRSCGSLHSFSTYNSLVNNCAPHHTLPALPSHLPPAAPANSARSSSLRPGWGLRHRKTSATSLASTATYSTLPTSLALQLYHTEVVEVLLVADQHGYGFTLSASAFPSDILAEPPVISQVEPNSAAQRSAVIQEGDRLVAVNGHFLDGRTLNEINQMLHNSSPKVTLHVEFAVAESVVTTTGTFTVKLAKRCSTLGITISAPTKRKTGDPLVISDVKKGSVAYRTGTIHAGDHLLAIDSVRTDTCSIEEAARLLQQADSVVKLKIRKDDTFSEEQDAAAAITYTVELPKQGGPLGITVSGTEDPFDPIFISGLTKGGLAEKTGALHVGDRILAINGETLQGHPLSEAIRMLQLTHAAVTLKITRPTTPPKCKNGVAGKAHDSVDSALESWDSSGLDSNNATNGRAVTKAKQSNTHNEGSGSSSSGKEEPILPTIHCYGPPGGNNGSWRQGKPYMDVGDGELHINEDDWSHSSGATCSPSVPLSFSSSNDADDWSTRLYELDQLSSINRSAPTSKRQQEGSTKKPASTGTTSEEDVISPSQLDDNANSVLYELDESSSHLAYENGQGALRQNGCLSGNSSPDLDDEFGDLPGKSLGAEMHLREVEEELQNIFTPTPVELFRVVLRKYSSLDDFGFGVSDGIYEKGVFISAIRPGGPADQSGVLNQYDRLLQVNDVRTKELDCSQVVPLIANAGNQVELVLSRNPIAEVKLRQRDEDYELWEMQPDDGLNIKEV